MKKMISLFEMAGFSIYNITENVERPYFCFTHEGTNGYAGLLYTDQPENTMMEILFSECKRVGRIQVRQELSQLINIINHE